MISFRFQGPGKPLPLSTRLLLILGGLAAIVLLSFFAFTFVIVALVVTAIFFLLNLFGVLKPPQMRNMRHPGPEDFQSGFHPPPSQRRPTKRETDDDVIDV